jgi:hypothetical protein
MNDPMKKIPFNSMIDRKVRHKINRRALHGRDFTGYYPPIPASYDEIVAWDCHGAELNLDGRTPLMLAAGDVIEVDFPPDAPEPGPVKMVVEDSTCQMLANRPQITTFSAVAHLPHPYGHQWLSRELEEWAKTARPVPVWAGEDIDP